MTRKRTTEEKAALKAARRQATERAHEREAERAAREHHEQIAARFNKRSTPRSVDESLDDRALTDEEYRVAEARRLIGPVPRPEPRQPFDALAATDWLGSEVHDVGRRLVSHKPTDPDYPAPDSYVPSDDAERIARSWTDDDADDELRDELEKWEALDQFADEQNSLGERSDPVYRWLYDDWRQPDEYDDLAEEQGVDLGEIDDRPDWDRS